LFELWSQLIERRPRLLGALIAGLSALAVLAAAGLEFDDVARGIFRTEDEDFARLEELFEDFGSDDLDCLVLLELTDAVEADEDWFSARRAASLRELSLRAEALSEVDSVLALDRVLDFSDGPLPRSLLPSASADAERRERARELAAEHPFVRGQLLSEDGRATLLVARLVEGTDSMQDVSPVVSALQSLLDELEQDGAVRARLTGIPPIRVEIFDVVQQDNIRQIVLASILATLVAFALLRNLRALLATSGPALVGALWSFACVRLVDGELDILNVILPPVVMVIGMADAMHLVMRMRELRDAGASTVGAAVESVRLLGLPCLLTSLTTAVGFGSLCLSRLDIIREFGMTAASAVGLTFLVVLTLSPLLARGARELGRSAIGPAAMGRWLADRVAAQAIRHARVVSALGVLLVLLCGVIAVQLAPDNRLTEATPRNRDSFRALEIIDTRFGGSAFAGVLVEWQGEREVADGALLDVLAEVRDAFTATPPFAGALTLNELFASLPGEAAASAALLEASRPDLLSRFVRPDRQRALVRARMPNLSSSQAELAASALEERLDAVALRHPDFELALTGTTIVARRNIDDMILDLARGLGAAALIIVIVIGLALRSVRLGLISILPNAFPLVVVAALMVLFGQSLQVVSAVSFTILLAIAVDDTIHVLSAFRRALADGLEGPEAALRATREVSAAIVATTLILVVGFAVMFISEVPSNRTVATICCLGFPAALVGDLLLLPACLAAFWPRSGSVKAER